MKRVLYGFLVVLALGGTVIGARQWKRHRAQVMAGANALPSYNDDAYDTRAPEGVRIKVEVFNATTSRGLGRRATIYLRDRGFDVVLTGTTRQHLSQTLVLDRSHHPAWAQLLAKAMRARVESRPDTSRYVDATVLVGGNWAPPPLPFYP